ncbi:MAG: hypothetical protein GX481_02765 [Atopobium sp.]|nr:hypothetical protein [Atopobium sp.]
MDIQKPTPLMVGGKAYYTLTSYDPVSIEVKVPRVTDDDVTSAFDSMVTQSGGDVSSAKDPSWLKQHFGTDDMKQIRATIHAQVTDANYELLNQQREQACATELAKRLAQCVPASHVAEVRRQMAANLAQQIQASGMGTDQFLAKMGIGHTGLEALLDRQAQSIAEQEAALGAFAQEKKLGVTEEDYPRLLHISASRCQKLLVKAKSIGQTEQLHDSALHNRALEIVVAESKCSYSHETVEEAATRNKHIHAAQGQVPPQVPFKKEGEKTTGTSPKLHLV